MRSKARKRKDDAYSRNEFNERDRVELAVGIGDVIALADIFISSAKTIDDTISSFKEVLEEILEKNEIGVING